MSEKIYDRNKLAQDIKLIKESLAKQEPGAKGFSESQGAAKTEEAKTVIRGNFREFLKVESKKSWVPSEVPKFKEAIGAQSAGSAIPMIWSAEPEMLSPESADGFFLTKNNAVVWKEDLKDKPGNIVSHWFF